MSEDGMYMFLTYGKFLGIGYIRDNQGWHLLVLFSSLKEANQLWDAEFKQLDEKSVTISFVEHKTDYQVYGIFHAVEKDAFKQF